MATEEKAVDNDNQISNVTDDVCGAEGDANNSDNDDTDANIKKDINFNKDNNKVNDKINNGSIKIKININSLLALAAIVAVIIAAILYKIFSSRATIDNFDCIDTPIYIPANGRPYRIDAFSKGRQNDGSMQCEWSYEHKKIPKQLLVTEQQTCKLKLQHTISTGQLDVKLIVSRNKDRTMCPLKLIFHPVPYFGIDLGTTYSSIAYQKAEIENGKRTYDIVILDNNKYSMPTAIYIPPNNYDVIQLGQNALNMRHKYPENVIYDVKRIIGRRASDNITIIKEFNDTHSFIVDVDTDNKLIIKIPKYIYNDRNQHIDTQYKKYYPEETLSPILAHLVHIASKKFDVPYITDIVISVPAYFNNNQRKAIKNACKIAGLNPVQLVIEPTAAALSHAYYNLLPEDAFDLFMVFDYGGGTLDCSILQCYDAETCEVYFVGGDSLLGGIDYDHVIVNIMEKKFKKEHGWKTKQFTPKKDAEFLLEAEKVKLQLSKPKQTPAVVFMNNGISTEKIVIKISDFLNDKQTKKLLDRAIKAAKQTINDDPDHTEANLKTILLVGGTSQIPMVRKKLQAAFDKVDIPEPDKQCQLTVVKGVSVIGGELAFGGGGVRRSNATNKAQHKIDVTPYSLGFKICNGSHRTKGTTCDHMDILVGKGARYPVYNVTRAYEPYNDARMKAVLELYEGNDVNISNNVFVSEVTIYGFTETHRVCDVTFQIDENGILGVNVTVRGKEEDIYGFVLSVNDCALTEEDIVELRHKMAAYDIFPTEIRSMLLK